MREFRLYAITDLKVYDERVCWQIEKALSGGVDIVQLRSKSLSDRELLKLGSLIRKIASREKKLLIINDRTDLALALDADGVHLGQEDMPIEIARKLLGRGKFVGLSTHNLGQAEEAQARGADYVGFGPIFATPTKPTYHPVGLRAIRAVTAKVKIPVVFIGGINESNIGQVIAQGAKRVAVVRAIFGSHNPHAAAQDLRRRLCQ